MTEVTIDHSGHYEPRRKPYAESMAKRNADDKHLALPMQSSGVEQVHDVRKVQEKTGNDDNR